MGGRVLSLACALLACLAVAAGSDDYKKKGECLAAALVGLPDTYASDDAACVTKTSKAACLATLGWVLVSNPQQRRASCSWREWEKDSFKDSHILYRSIDGYSGGKFDATNFGGSGFCSMLTEVALPAGLKRKMIIDAHVSAPVTIAAISSCLAGYRLGSECKVSLTDPGLAAGEPPSYVIFDQLIGAWSLVDPASTYDRVVYAKNTFKLNCGRSGSSKRLAGDNDKKGWVKYLDIAQTTLGLPETGITSSYSSWRYAFTTQGFLYDFIQDTVAVGSTAKAEVEILKGTSPGVPVVAYIINIADFNDWRASCSDPCPAPVSVALASCYPGKRGKCEMTVQSFPATGGPDYGLFVSRLTLNTTANPITDTKSINVAYKLYVKTSIAPLAGPTVTTVTKPGTAAIKPSVPETIPDAPVVN